MLEEEPGQFSDTYEDSTEEINNNEVSLMEYVEAVYSEEENGLEDKMLDEDADAWFN